ncbi:metallophosphoesterase family protein [Ktedonosporobacter rubrisoli]|nr:metallophosphoesterase family protein [Ktedonosporobacter rubrisoli]
MTQQAVNQPFTLAILADIHGNLAALEAVLDDLQTQAYDQLIIAGDLVMNAPYPAETLALIRSLQAQTLFGETDRAVVAAGKGNSQHALACWTAEQLGADGLAYLESLAFSHLITPSQSAPARDELLVVHATPTEVGAFLILQPNALDARCSALTPEAEARALLGQVRTSLIIHGHLHYASTGFVGEQQVVSVGAVGFPFDGKHEAAYALANWDGVRWEIKHRRVPYDYAGVIAAMMRIGQPDASTMAQRLRSASWCSQLS